MRGFVDSVTSAGTLEGWAYDERHPLVPVLVAAVDAKGGQVAAGLANRFRKDLADARVGYGWCSFKLRIDAPLSRMGNTQVKLIDLLSGTVISPFAALRYEEAPPYAIDTIDDLAKSDPTALSAVEQINDCREIFDEFFRARGVETFMRAAYAYLLNRPIDESGLASYARLLAKRRLSPLAVMRSIADSSEFKAQPRRLLAPNQPGFPFRLNAA